MHFSTGIPQKGCRVLLCDQVEKRVMLIHSFAGDVNVDHTLTVAPASFFIVINTITS